MHDIKLIEERFGHPRRRASNYWQDGRLSSMDLEVDRLHELGMLKGSIKTTHELRERLSHASIAAHGPVDINFMYEENVAYVRSLRALMRAIEDVERHLVDLESQRRTYNEEKREFGLECRTFRSQVQNQLRAFQRPVEKGQRSRGRRKGLLDLKAAFVWQLTLVWWDLTHSRPTPGKYSKFHRFCRVACEWMYPPIRSDSLDSAVRKACKLWRDSHPELG